MTIDEIRLSQIEDRFIRLNNTKLSKENVMQIYNHKYDLYNDIIWLIEQVKSRYNDIIWLIEQVKSFDNECMMLGNILDDNELKRELRKINMEGPE